MKTMRVNILEKLPTYHLNTSGFSKRENLPKSLLEGYFRFYLPDLKRLATHFKLRSSKNQKNGVIIKANGEDFSIHEIWDTSHYSWEKSFNSEVELNLFVFEILSSQLIFHLSDIKDNYWDRIDWGEFLCKKDHIKVSEVLLIQLFDQLLTKKDTIRIRPVLIFGEGKKNNSFDMTDKQLGDLLLYRSQLKKAEKVAGRQGEEIYLTPLDPKQIEQEFLKLKKQQKKRNQDKEKSYFDRFRTREESIVSDLVNLNMMGQTASKIYSNSDVEFDSYFET